MKKNFLIVNTYVLGIVLLCTTVLQASDLTDEGECPIVVPDFDDMMLLTREERIQLMDQALKDALSQVQDCKQHRSDMQTQNSSGATDAAATDADGENTNTDSSGDNANSSANDTEAEQNDAQNQQTATPSSELSGSEAPKQQPSTDMEPSSTADEYIDTQPPQTAIPSGELSGTEAVESKIEDSDPSSDEQPVDTDTVRDDKRALDNGKLPEDIPPADNDDIPLADNDDIIAKQIRAAALAEPDPLKQAKLWNEYRRYKGISEKQIDD